MAQNDPTVYRDLKSYVATKASHSKRVVKHKFKVKSDSRAVAAIVSGAESLPYSVDRLINIQTYGDNVGVSFDDVKTALEHYRSHWQDHLSDPHPLFETKTYIDAVGGIEEVELSPIDDFAMREERFTIRPSALFDSVYYRTRYPWTTSQNPLIHFLSSGFKERHRPVQVFDTDYYLAKHHAKLGDVKNAYLHFLSDGWLQHLDPHPMVDMTHMSSQLKSSDENALANENPFLALLKGANISPSPWFDPAFFRLSYAEANPSASEEDTDTSIKALQHFIRVDTPPADPSSRFSELFYRYRNPDIGALNGLYHYLRYGRFEMRPYYSSMADLKSKAFQDILAIEPDICAPHQDISRATIVSTPRSQDPQIQAMQNLVAQRGSFLPDVIYIFHGFVKGGAEKYGAKLVNNLAASQPDLKILVIAYDTDEMTSRHWIDDADNVHVISANALQLNLSLQHRSAVLAKFLIWCDAKLIINNNSDAGWEAIATYGHALRNFSKLVCTLFCYDFDAHGHAVGYARSYIRETIDIVDVFITDNTKFGARLVEDFSLGSKASAKFKTLFQHTETDIVAPKKPKARKNPRVLWAARMSAQKNIGLLRELALRFPRVTFCVWTLGSWDSKTAGGSKPANVNMVVSSEPFAKIAADDMDLFLLTSDWEGLPTTIIEATVAGLPIITSNVGGVSDLINKNSGWVVPPGDLEAFTAALTEALDNPQLGFERVGRAQKHLQKQHSPDAYIKRLKTLGFAKPARPKRDSNSPKVAAQPASSNMKTGNGIPTRVLDIPLAKTKIDVSICVNGHREGALILPTLRSCFAAYDEVLAAGSTGEMIIVLDNPDEDTRDVCDNFAETRDVKIIEINVRDLGLARNSAIRAAQGRYVAFMDGDDLMSANWVIQGVHFGDGLDKDVILHPSSNYIFGNGDTYYYVHRDMDDPEFELSALIAENYWTAISMGPRDLYLKHPYETNQIKTGLAYEDWSWHCKTIAEGVTHKIVPGTSHFIRRKKRGSLLAMTSSSGALPRLYHLRDHSDLYSEADETAVSST